MSKKPRGSILKIREFELEKIQLVDEFDILQIVGEGWFGKILLVEHRASQTEMVLKAVPKPYVSLRDFYREFHYGLHLGIHRNIVTTYDVAFETAGFYVFTQEYAPLGDLTSNITETGVGEVYSKRVAKQIAAALDYMHAKDIVHRDVKLDNVLIYRSDFSRVKLCDFGESFQTGTIVERRNEWLPYSPPEVLDIKPEGTYQADPSHDVWQFGIVLFVCLTGCLPWQKASSEDPRYMRYLAWQGTMMLPIRRTPKLFKLLTSRAQRMFRRFLEPRFIRRPKNFSDLMKFIDDRWLAKTAEKEMAEYETDELCPSMYSFHSSPDEKHRLLYTLADCGIETHVDRQAKKNRIKDWIESSVITEEDEVNEENEETNSTSPSSSISREPVAGHISSIKAKEIKTTLKDSNQKHFDPRTGALQQGPSEMGTKLLNQKSASASTISNLSTINNSDSLLTLGGSLLTLGSRQDLLSSNLQIFNSEFNLNNLGMTSNAQQQEQQQQQQQQSSSFIRSRNMPIQRSRSDSVKMAMFNNGPAPLAQQHQQQQYKISNNNLNTNWHLNSMSNSSNFMNVANLGNKTMNPFGNGNATASGIASTVNKTFQMLSQNVVTAPNNALLQMDQKKTINFLNQSNDSQVRDSAYGSTEMSGSPIRTTYASTTTTTNLNVMNSVENTIRQTSTVRTQSSQQQRFIQTNTIGEASSMKDTAYDRVAVTNNNNARKRR